MREIDPGAIVIAPDDVEMLSIFVRQFDEAADDPDPVRGLGAQRDAASRCVGYLSVVLGRAVRDARR